MIINIADKLSASALADGARFWAEVEAAGANAAAVFAAMKLDSAACRMMKAGELYERAARADAVLGLCRALVSLVGSVERADKCTRWTLEKNGDQRPRMAIRELWAKAHAAIDERAALAKKRRPIE
jgi:hypothetical protein